MKYFVFCFLLFCFIFEANRNNKVVASNMNAGVDTIPYSRPLGIMDTLPFAGNVDNYEKLIEFMQLKDLNSSSSETFRVWFEYGMSFFGTSIILSRDNEGWVGYRYVFKVLGTTPGEYGDTITAIDFKSELKKTCFWRSFFSAKN